MSVSQNLCVLVRCKEMWVSQATLALEALEVRNRPAASLLSERDNAGNSVGITVRATGEEESMCAPFGLDVP